MALQSQMARTGVSRRFMASKRRRSRRWPVLLTAVVVVGGLWWLVFGGTSESEGDDGPAVAVDQEVEEAGGGAVDGSGEASRIERRQGSYADVSQMPPVAEVDSRATRSSVPEVPTLTLGGASAAGSTPPSVSRAAGGTSQPTSRATSEPAPASASRQGRQGAAGVSVPASVGSGSDAVRQGMDLIADGKLVEGRRVLSRLLFNDRRPLPASDARAIRETLGSVNQRLVFSPEVVPGDPLVESYRIQSGDSLARIAPRYKLTATFLQQINGISHPRRIQVGQSIKLIRGPFHARVFKSDYRMDLFLREPDGSPIYVRSFTVGLGEDDSTPEGMWVIEPGRKVVNPDWRNPRTGEYYRSDDPQNPIGNYWLAMKGTDANTAGKAGYGIHGTIEPGSIGRSASMGCIRLNDADIEQIFYLLVEGDSTVEVVR